MPRSCRVLRTRRRKAAPWLYLRRRSTDCADARLSQHEANFIPFSAYTRMSGVDIDGRMLRKGASSAIANFVKEMGGKVPAGFDEMAERIARTGGTPLAVADDARALGVIHLKDIVKGGMKERMSQLALPWASAP